MAIENNYGGPPSLEIYQDFVRSVSLGDLDQNAVIVAEQYDVYTKDNTTEKLTKEYPVTESDDCSWNALGLGDGSAVDKKSVSLYFPAADVVQHTEYIVPVAGNTFTISKNLKTLQKDAREAIVVGDTVKVGDKIGQIMVIRDVDEKEEFSVEVTEVIINGTSGAVESITLKFTSTKRTVTEKLTNSTGFTDALIKGLGITYTVKNPETHKKGDKLDPITIESTLIMVKGSISEGSPTAKFCKKLPVTKKLTVKDTDTGVTVPEDIKTSAVFGDGAEVKGCTVVAGTFYICLRAHSTKNLNKLTLIDVDNQESLGVIDLQNPIAAMTAVALKGGRPVYAIAVGGDTREAYRKAFSVLAKSTNAYGIVLGSTKEDIIAECMTFVEQQAAPSVANYKIMYYGLPAKNVATLMDDVSATITATSTETTVKLPDTEKDAGFYVKGILKGDKVVIDTKEYTVDSVKSNIELTLTDTATESGTRRISITRVVEGSELVELLKNSVYTTSHRAYCVFGDGINVDGFENAPAWLLAALPAGMRAGEYCQRPISNLVYNNCTADNKMVLAPGNLRELASRGVWILANTADGSQVYNYHQLSTDMSDKKLQEQSYTTNFDNISRGARALLAPYYGNSNISEDFLNQMQANLMAYLGGLTKNAPNVEIGPQLIEYSNLTITQDPVTRDAVYMQVDYAMPAPFNHVTLRQRLI